MKKQTLPRVELHPATLKFFKLGHPWVTKDTFTAKFPKEDEFLVGKDRANKDFAILLNDHKHPKIKARLFSTLRENQKPETFIHDFPKMFEERLSSAITKRIPLIEQNERENLYLCFAEADRLPGLFILKLGRIVLVQSYIPFWDKRMKQVSKVLLSLKDAVGFDFIWWQKRDKEQKVKTNCLLGEGQKSWIIKEFGISYRITLGEYYDFGIYTDMSAIRKKLIPYFQESKSFLNLYSYTGAYSLFALKQGVKDVSSVDLSPIYIKWLENNIKLNPELMSETQTHTGHTKSVDVALSEFIKKGQQFDLIVCDPPSSSSDGGKVSRALDAYNDLLPKLHKTLSAKGHAIIFLNTHTITKNKFMSKIQDVIKKSNLGFTIKEEIQLLDDCPTLKHFPEGDYLKGLVLQKS